MAVQTETLSRTNGSYDDLMERDGVFAALCRRQLVHA